VLSGLEAADLKLKRASDHIKEINHHILAYSARVLHEVIPDAEGKDTVHVREAPPPEISIVAGEVLQQVRSSLDYLAFDLVKLNPGKIALPLDWEKNCCFPLWLNAPKKPPVYNCFKNVLPGISKPVFAFIHGSQPYHRGKYGIFDIPTVLWLLAELSNTDKHRHLNLTPLNIGHMEMVTTKLGMGHISYRTVRSGAKLEPPLPPDKMADAVNVERTFSSYITFDESVLGPGFSDLAVSLILEKCIDTVKFLIVPAFTQFLK
jgi:hypothetical protein